MSRGEPLVPPGLTHAALTERITAQVLYQRAPATWWIALAISGLLALIGIVMVGFVFEIGVGLFGINVPVAWGLPIVNTIWWIGIAHAGTLISGMLLLTRQQWRDSINRLAEMMAMFAIMMAGSFPLIHLGRPWFFYYLLPYPNTMNLWPQWRSPLVWDFFAIATYLVYTSAFLYLSLLPDLATLRDRTRRRGWQVFYGLLALGWRNSAVHWARYQRAVIVLAAVSAPVVLSVTGIISLDLAVTIVPGYHFTIFPPYFVAGALYSGFATVAILAITFRHMFKLQDLITLRHLDYIGRLMLVFVLVVDYAYTQEWFIAWYSGSEYYYRVFIDRWTGPYAPVWWSMAFLNIVLAQLLWFPRVRRSPPMLLLLAIGADAGMFLERFQIVFTSTHAGYTPSMWGQIWPTVWDWMIFLGSLALFTFMLLVLIRLTPLISLHDMRNLIHKRGQNQEGGSG
ncbi:MAG: polysulfide reductase NrfD [Nitrococcus sp.]|nr:polysulfide reductase NrfD [Nitrococcus sp.]